ncbi:kinase-like domain-containing protein [Hygrophoropsis aurantiaca]|uniref:Kinase-like domain-containing protein n=1 Tax=Hygrophoropsis aurantiaca TaxID=72124 RepID=A0ACB7ZTM7_9AGAM|nr:kinase-like domain-containing protein [Hygrophoropsis aurantiaca]
MPHAPTYDSTNSTHYQSHRSRKKEESYSHGVIDLSGQITKQGTYPVAHGGFSDVWKCQWRFQWPKSWAQVAVKVIRAQPHGREDETKKNKRLRRELNVWMRLNHPNILPLCGVTSDFGPFVSLVCPWMENGTLTHFLAIHHPSLTLEERFTLLSDVAAGLSYLHSSSVIHGDLSGSNILINKQGKACLSDFGLSAVIHEFEGTSYFTSSIRGAVRWMAPEIYDISDPSLPTKRSDIYSFGCVMLQVLSGAVPYSKYGSDAHVLVAMSQKLKPDRPSTPKIDDRDWEFMKRCWSAREKGLYRPTINEVVDFCSWPNIARDSPRQPDLELEVGLSKGTQLHGLTYPLPHERRKNLHTTSSSTTARRKRLSVLSSHWTAYKKYLEAGPLLWLLADNG